MQSTPDFFGWTDIVVGTMPGYTITVSDTNAWANPVRFYRIFSNTPEPSTTVCFRGGIGKLLGDAVAVDLLTSGMVQCRAR